MCQTSSVTPPPHHPSAAHAPRAQLLPTEEQHSTLQGLIISLFRLNGKTRNVLGRRCCFGAAIWCRSPAGGLDTLSIWFSERTHPCPSAHTCSLMVRGARTHRPQSPPLAGAVGSQVAQWGLQPPPRGRLSQQELSLPVCIASWH